MPRRKKGAEPRARSPVRLAPLMSRTQPVLLPSIPNNPLDVFPSKSDTISKAFFHLDIDKHQKRQQQKEDNSERWLHPDKIDPTFGIKGNNSSTDSTRELRRAYRRLESSALFKPAQPHDISLSDFNTPIKSSKTFILVEESRLEELSRLESMLQQEKRLLGEQCAWAMADVQFHARIPLPATRLAIRSRCDEQIKTTNTEMARLLSSWRVHCLKNHYDRPHLYTTESYLKAAPAGQKALKLRLVREAAATWRIRKDRDSMRFEDDLSYLSNKRFEAQLRARDYERYYILAARYGPFAEEEFNADARPGRRYYIKAARGAIKLQLAWDRYWAVQKLRRYRACRLIQKHVRRRLVYKRLHPIIWLRLKIGRKTYYMYCWHLWLEYNRICRRIREAIEFKLQSTARRCFDAWSGLSKHRKLHRQRSMQLMRVRTANKNLYNKFFRWQQFTRRHRTLKLHLKRLFAFPHFDVWVEYTKWSKHVKKLHRAAAVLQSLVRMFLARVLLLRAQKAQQTLRGFNLLVLCVRSVRFKRQAQILREFVDWKPQELLRRAHRSNDLERARIQKRQQLVQEKEKAAQRQLRKHLKSADGQLQLAELAQEPATAAAYDQRPLKNSTRRGFSSHTTLTADLNASPTAVAATSSTAVGATAVAGKGTAVDVKFSSLSKREKSEYAQSLLLRECAAVARQLEIHNFNAKHAPFLKCPDPACAATFTTEAQYHSHLHSSTTTTTADTISTTVAAVAQPHCGQQLSSHFSEFHVLLRHFRGQELLRHYLMHKYGLAGAVNSFDAWIAIQEWRKTPTSSEQYISKAMSLFDMFIAEDATRPTVITSLYMKPPPQQRQQRQQQQQEQQQQQLLQLREKLLAIKHRNHRGFFQRLKAKPSLLRALVGFQGQDYYQWNTAAILHPTALDAFEWSCFLDVFHAVDADLADFKASTDYCLYLQSCAEEDAQREQELQRDYEKYRLTKIRIWSKDFKAVEDAMSAKAGEAVEAVMQRLIDRCYFNGSRLEVYKRSVELRHVEQAAYEEREMRIEEACYSSEDNILEDVFHFYVRSMIDHMLQLPSCRKGLLQYSGLLRSNMMKRLTLAEVSSSSQQDWFDGFFSSARDLEVVQYGIISPVDEEEEIATAAAARIQARFRGALARNTARAVFVQVYNKVFDHDYQSYYYFNNNTGQSSWYRPYITDRLFVNLNW